MLKVSLVSDGKRFLAQNHFARAERLADEALQFQQQYYFVLHGATEAADLQNQVKYHYYIKHIDTGKRYLNEKNFAAALNQFEAALEMEKAYSLQRVQQLVAITQKAAKPVLLQELQATYDSHFQKVKDLASNKNYLAADKAYKAAIDVADGNAACHHVATFTARDGREAIMPAVTYQRMLADIDRFVASSRYTEAIEFNIAAEKHYVNYQVNRFGLDHISLYNYAKNSKKHPFTASVVQYLAGRGEDKIALDLLRSLLENGYAKRKTNKVQDQLGRQLAQRDVQLGIKEEPKVYASAYINCNRKLNRLGDTYVKERKRLAKS